METIERDTPMTTDSSNEVIQVGNIVDDSIGFKNPQRGRIYSADGLSPCIYCFEGGGLEPKIIEPIGCAMRGRNPENPSERGRSNGKYKQRIEMGSNIRNTITSVQKDSLVAEPTTTTTICLEPKIVQKFGDRGSDQYSVRDIEHTIPANPMSDRGQMLLEPTKEYKDIGYEQITETNAEKCCAEVWRPSSNLEHIQPQKYRIRKLTCRECFRLMGVDDAEIDKIQASGISNSQQYKCAGNSIVVDVLYHLFRKMFVETENESQQLTLF